MTEATTPAEERDGTDFHVSSQKAKNVANVGTAEGDVDARSFEGDDKSSNKHVEGDDKSSNKHVEGNDESTYKHFEGDDKSSTYNYNSHFDISPLLEGLRQGKDSPHGEHSYQDPTESLIDPGGQDILFSSEAFLAWRDCLQRERVLLLCSYDQYVLTSAAYQISRDPPFSSSRRILKLTDEDSEKPSFDDLRDERLANGEPCIILVDATTKKAQTFIHSMPDQRMLLDTFRGKLRNMERYVLIIGTNDSLPSAPCYEEMRKEVNFLLPRLMTKYPDKFSTYLKTIERQRQAGRWPQGDEEFCEQVSRAMARSLREELKRRDDPNFGSITDVGPLFQTGNPIHGVVLFVATFFKKLPASDFRRIMILLLEEKCEPKTILTMSESGQNATDQTGTKRRLIDIWEEDYIKILADCGVEFTREIENNSLSGGITEPIVNFIDIRVRNEIYKAFLSTHVITFMRLFEIVYNRSLLFDDSLQIMEGAILLIIEVVAGNPSRYGHNFLLDLIRNFGLECARTSEESFEDCIRRLFAMNRIYYRIARLISGMLEEQRLRETVKSFFNQLIDRRLYDVTCELIWRLRYEDGIDKFYWWCRIAEKGKDKAYPHVVKDLIRTARQGSRQFVEVLQKAHQWLTEPGSEREEELAARFFVEICLQLTFLFRREALSWPPGNDILSALIDSSDGLEKDIVAGMRRHDCLSHLGKIWPQYMISYLRLHLLSIDVDARIGNKSDIIRERVVRQWSAKIEDICEADRSVTVSDHLSKLIQALITAAWAIEILSPVEKVPPAATALFKRLVKAIAEGFDRDTHRHLCDYWTMIADGYLEVNVGLREARGLTRDQRCELAQVKKQVARSRNAVLRLRREVSTLRI